MKFTSIIYTKMNIILIFMAQTSLSDIFQPFKREVQISKINIHSMNDTIFTVNKVEIKHMREKHVFYISFSLHTEIHNVKGTFEVLKCKDYYVDCVNVVSYEITKLCDKKLDVTFFILDPKKKELSSNCGSGVHVLQDMTLSADLFGRVFGLPNEKWWEYYWKINAKVYHENDVKLLTGQIQFYIIQYQNRNRTLIKEIFQPKIV